MPRSRTKLSPQQPSHGPRTIEALDAAFRTPATARDLCLFLMETGQIPLDENTPPTAKAFDQFFGAKPMSKEDRMRYEGIVAKAQEE